VITTLVLLGQVLELRARSQTSSAIKELLRLAPETATVIRDDGTEEVIDLRHVHAGDTSRPCKRKDPDDGEIVEGETRSMSRWSPANRCLSKNMPAIKSSAARSTAIAHSL
jgi:cation transport ATPase